MQRVVPTTSIAYLFLMAALLFGLPLLTSYYGVNPTFYSLALIPYLEVSVGVTFLILYLSRRVPNNCLTPFVRLEKPCTSTLFVRFGSVSVYVPMALVTAVVLAYSGMRIFVDFSFPYPPEYSGITNILATGFGLSYLFLLVPTVVLGFSGTLLRIFPILRRILEQRKYALTAVILFLSFAFIYLLLVNQIVIAGFNTIGNVSSPTNTYPYFHIFTFGPQQIYLNLVYIPYAVVQLTPSVNMLIIPFEIVFAIILSTLVASNVTLTYYLISNSKFRSCSRGTVISTGGSIIGLTATCPTCLVPSFVSAIFGGITAAEVVYENIYGVVLPPVLSITTLTISLVYLSRLVKTNTDIISSSRSPPRT
jgi:hypothetical protein